MPENFIVSSFVLSCLFVLFNLFNFVDLITEVKCRMAIESGINSYRIYRRYMIYDKVVMRHTTQCQCIIITTITSVQIYNFQQRDKIDYTIWYCIHPWLWLRTAGVQTLFLLQFILWFIWLSIVYWEENLSHGV